ncbi:MAG: DUF4382 domain-containing protein [Candidatus Sericytochromatia bacterium]|nr:DUF4382 domain-containing protein [Candidatus Tanganyikabacteria bacterium]
MTFRPWKHVLPAILIASAAGCFAAGPGGLLDGLDLILTPQWVDPATLPAQAAEAGNPASGAGGATLAVGMGTPPTWRTAASGGTASPSPGPARWGTRVRGIPTWTCDLIAFKPVRIEVHRVSDTPAATSSAGAVDAGTGAQDAESNGGSASGGSWVSVPLASDSAAVDLAALTAGTGGLAAHVFGTAQLSPGHYNQIRFWGADRRSGRESAENAFHATTDAGRSITGCYKLPGQILIVNGEFDIRADQQTALYFNFDPHEALKIAGRRVILRPTAVSFEAVYTPAATTSSGT